MKAIIPVAGGGTRLTSQPKALIPIAGKPVLGYIIDQFVTAGIEEFIFVVGFFGEKVAEYVREKHPNIVAHFVVQTSREGIGHAIWQARDLVQESDELMVMLGDTIIDFDINAVMSSPHSALGVRKVEDPRNFGVVQFGEDDVISSVVEKPSIPKSNLAIVGIYKIKEPATLFAVLEDLIRKEAKTQNEYQLTDAIQQMIEQGITFTGFNVENWYDCGKKEILLETNATLLKKLEKNGQESAFENTVIIHPVSIASSCKISNSIVGPNVTIGEGSTIDNSIIRNSIIGDNGAITEAVLHDSVIGGGAVIKGISQSLNIGDNTEIDFSS
jgi:glucose-1-phosphate thymidylyltransferase